MITPTHVVINVGLARWWRARPMFAHRPTRRMFILGGLAPDVGLFVMTVGAASYLVLRRGATVSEAFRTIFDDYFYSEPTFVIAHNLLHAPLVVLGVFAAGVLATRGGRTRLGQGACAFALGCAVHTALDIPVHHNDGPLLLFPFEWSIRFASPVSYYDPDHYGWLVGPIDTAITAIGILAITGAWLARRRRRSGSRLGLSTHS